MFTICQILSILQPINGLPASILVSSNPLSTHQRGNLLLNIWLCQSCFPLCSIGNRNSTLPLTPCAPAPLDELDPVAWLPGPSDVPPCMHGKKAKNYTYQKLLVAPACDLILPITAHVRDLPVGLSEAGERQRVRHPFCWCGWSHTQSGPAATGFQIWWVPTVAAVFPITEEKKQHGSRSRRFCLDSSSSFRNLVNH